VGYEDKINLPAFHDYQFGTYFLLKDNLPVSYSGSLSYDNYQVVIPSANNIIRKPDPSFRPARTVLPDVDFFPKDEEARSKALSMDSISTIGIDNQNHFVTIPWTVNSSTLVENSFGYQSQNWGVIFKEGLNIDGPLALSLQQQTFNLKSMAINSLDKNNTLEYGLSYDRLNQNYHAQMPWALYDVIVNSNMDMLSGLGYYTNEQFVIEREDSTKEANEYLGEFPLRLQFHHIGALQSHVGALFAAHEVKATESLNIKYGARAEYESNSREVFISPRLTVDKIINASHQLGGSAGVYSQNNFAFYKRDANRSLKSEKAAQLDTRYKYLFNDAYNLEWKNYYKQYYDLAVPVLVPEGTIDAKGLLIVNPNIELSEADEAELKAIVQSGDLNLMNDTLQALAYAAYGNQTISYINQGTGTAYGTELTLNYHPTRKWRGWVSGALSRSTRKDSPGDVTYNYRYHRPWSFNWVNYFDMPSRYEISFTYRLAAGHPYTPYTGTLQEGSDVLDRSSDIIVGKRNSAELKAYSRMDIRLVKNTNLFNHNLKTYIEVWNTFNQPNYFARDKNTGELKSVELNWPFPFFFVGFSYDL